MVSPLLPDRHPVDDFFVCDILDAPLKDDMASMEHPIFSLSTKPDTRIREYTHNGAKIKIIPSTLGLATIHDKDILIFCISQLIAKMNRGEQPSREIHLKAQDLLIATNRPTDGRSYARLKDSFERLNGTRVTTNIATGDVKTLQGFGLIDEYEIVAKNDQSEQMVSLKITLSKWMYNSILGKEVLTLNRNYFRLRKPVERRVYEIARKHCGQRVKWEIGLELLQKKCGSSAQLREFRRMIKALVTHDHLPDYQVAIDAKTDLITFSSRNTVPLTIQGPETETDDIDRPSLYTETYEKVQAMVPRHDVYRLESQWIQYWIKTGKKPLNNPDGAFINFCKNRIEKPVQESLI